MRTSSYGREKFRNGLSLLTRPALEFAAAVVFPFQFPIYQVEADSSHAAASEAVKRHFGGREDPVLSVRSYAVISFGPVRIETTSAAIARNHTENWRTI